MALEKNHPRWSELIDGRLPYSFKTVSASMLLNRLNRTYKSEPTPQNLNRLIEEAYNFFVKYEALFKDDLNKIFI